MSDLKKATPLGMDLDRKSILSKSRFLVELPKDDGLFLDTPAFTQYINSISQKSDDHVSLTVRSFQEPETEPTSLKPEGQEAPLPSQPQPFMAALHSARLASMTQAVTSEKLNQTGKMLTENGDVAYSQSQSPLVDLFYELEDAASGQRLDDLLKASWNEDPLSTLKVIWNARSIHLGKSNRNTFYRCYGWLAENHPQTALANLRWVARPVIAKKVDTQASKPADKADDDDLVLLDDAGNEIVPQEDSAFWDVEYGVAHGYWKDLLNLVVLAANDHLTVLSNPSKILKPLENDKRPKAERTWAAEEAKQQSRAKDKARHDAVFAKFNNNPFYRALHLSVAKLFAEQLKEDNVRLNSRDKKSMRHISLAAKWAPSLKGFHDRHIRIASTIAEAMYNGKDVDSAAEDREMYLRNAREEYRRLTLSPLRRHLEVVERDVSAENFDRIKYDRVPSIAMKNYGKLFITKDFERFDEYISGVAQGKKRISGATLLPSTLVQQASHTSWHPSAQSEVKNAQQLLASKIADIESKMTDGQWKTLVQRVKDSGTLESSIAVCDVSGSMTGPRFPDGTSPIDSSIGLSLLLAEITQPPFGGAIITFSENPAVVRVGGIEDTRSLAEKIQVIARSNWSMNTDFVAVFERLILPMAVENKIKPEDMVKQVFVFSDMHFDHASGDSDRFTSSYERIKDRFAQAGYQMPKLIFWNLAGSRVGTVPHARATRAAWDDRGIAPKPVSAFEEGTALVSGYSQGQMKMFLANGQFENEEKEEMEKKESRGESSNPLTVVKRAIAHKAYKMLKVID